MSHAPLFEAALLGTARIGTPPAAPHPALLATWQGISTEDPAAAVLQALALTRAFQHAGARSTEAPGSAGAAPGETRDELSPAAVDAGMRLLKGEFPELLPEWLRLSQNSDRVVPGRCLPELLAAATKDSALRPAVRAIAGERGRWIARRHGRFSWMLEDSAVPDHAWDDGQPAERLAWLRQTRATDPARAAAAIAAQWSGEEAEMRTNILRLIAAAPAPCDEAWLEELALEHRRQEARELTVSALSRLEDSAFRRRAVERAGRMVKVTNVGITLVVPGAFDPEWERDGIKEKPPRGTGEKAWWLRQALGLVPLADWAGLLGCAEKKLFALPLDPDGRETILLAWLDGARRVPERALPARLVPFLATLDPWPDAAPPNHAAMAGLLAAVPVATGFSLLDRISDQIPAPLVLDLLEGMAEPPPTGTGKRLKAILSAAIASHPGFLTRPQARALALCVPPGEIPRQLQAIGKLPKLSGAAEEFATTLEFRQSLIPHFETL